MLACALACLVGLAWAPAAVADAQGAGLVIVFGPDDVHEACIAFSETTISGVSLLSRAGLGAVTVSEPDGGVSVCRIAEVGCDFPQEACDCQCGDPCLGWHYWAWDGAAWQPWEGSPADRSVGSGDVDAWVWGSADDRPPALLDDGPCGPTLEQPVQISSDDAYPEPPAQPVTMEPYPGDEPSPTQAPQATLTPRATATPTPATAPGTPGGATEPAATATSTEPAASASATATLERVELEVTESPTPSTLEPMVTLTPDAGATLVVRAATRGAAAPTAEPRPDPDAPVATGRLAAAAIVALGLVLGAVWWRHRTPRSDEPPES
jgi:hypothetical protein